MMALARPLRLLLIDDDEDDYVITRDLLQRMRGLECRFDWRASFEEGLAAILSCVHDLYLVDYRLGPRTGIELLQQAVGAGNTRPFIILTGQGDYDVDLEAMRAGAADYLVKAGLTAEQLERAIRYALERCDRLEAEDNLRRSEARFRTLFEDNADGLLVLDPEGRVLLANPAVEGLIGRHPEELIGMRYDLGALREGISEIGLAGADGEGRHIEIRAAHTGWAGGGAWLLALRDITARRAAERELRLREQAIQVSSNGIVIVDIQQPGQPITYVNPAFERITGYRAEEVIGRNCRFLQGSETQQAGLNQIRLALAERREGHALLRNYRKDGSLFWNDLHVAPVRDEKDRVRHFIGIINDITEHKRYELEVAHRASHDYLTDLPNRHLLEDRLAQALNFVSRLQRMLAVLFIDLDRFKLINDSLGHAVGDQVLKCIAERLQTCVRQQDTVSRLGGDEFVVLLVGVLRFEDVLVTTQRLIDAVVQPISIEQHNLYLTCSIGISVYPEHGDDPLKLIQYADLAMYRAKEQGRNNYQVFSDEFEHKLYDRLSIAHRLRDGLDKGELMLYYQPQVSAVTGEIVGVEALIRWHRPDTGILNPDRFIPIAEDSGQIVSIGSWVLEEACRQNRHWREAGISSFSVAVNISSLQFQRPNFVDEVKRVLTVTGLEPQFLELELTESIVMENAERVIATLRQLKALGVKVTLDDFGTGYSSLSYLKKFSIDKIKIDRSFVKDVSTNSDDAAIARSIIAIAHHLRLRVIAEGVESEAQIGYLRKNHCDEFQGFYFCHPLPPQQVEEVLRRRRLVPAALSAASDAARTVLLVDDEENILRALQRVLRRDGYRILTATNADEGFEILARHDVQVIISDQRMPGINGTEFLSRVKDMYPETMRIVLSGYTDLHSVTEAINRGEIYKFLTKPWEDEVLRANVQEAFRTHARKHERE
ncbi:MAG TPA: EAL domain-containing protein [Candidatus Competibacteraceae bacterium]|nr:EAL domain-containing protein [Candidatus Competibacteraceae bacterium]